MRIHMIAAVSRNRVIGRGGGLPWHLPADLKYFKTTTQGCPVIMGRRTYESVGMPLPGRRTVVLTRDPTFRPAGVEVAGSLTEALKLLEGAERVFLLGGEKVFREGLSVADRLYITWIHCDFQGDTFFPPFPEADWVEISRVERPADTENPYPMSFVIYERRETRENVR
ncbi:MAG TPA: dihydrofolate reductase [Acidobacteriota bacterium]|nr:dihydrofolate reductase [Acidobacteriota bacterium]